MSFRVSALVAFLVVGSASIQPAFAQPQVPLRPQNSVFGNLFSSGPQFGQQGFGGFNGGFNQGGGFAPNVVGGVNGIGPVAPGFLYPGQTALPQAFPGAYAVNPQLPASGIVGSFNNLGHWYGARAGNYGHWYPNGVANGRGVLGYGGGGGGFGGAYGGNVTPTVGAGGLNGARGSIGGTALGVGATVGQFRR